MDSIKSLEKSKKKQKNNKTLYIMLFLICFILALSISSTAKAESPNIAVVSTGAILGKYKSQLKAFEIQGIHQGSIIKGKQVILPETCLTESPVMEKGGKLYLKVDAKAVKPLQKDKRVFTYQFVLINGQVTQLKILDRLMAETVSVWKTDSPQYALNKRGNQ